MTKTKKVEPSTKKLSAIDPVGSYGNKLVTIQGLVSETSQCAWPGRRSEYGEYGTHCFHLAAWRMVGGPLVVRELYVQRPIRRSRDWPDVFQKQTVHRMQVLLSEDQTRAVFARRLRMTKPDIELVELSVQLTCPVILATEEFGEFTLNRSLNWFEGKARWKNLEVNITLPGPNSAILKDDFELPELERPMKAAFKVWKAQKTWDRKCKQCAVRELLEIKNKHWLEEGEPPLSATKFAANLQLTSLQVDADGRMELWYNAGEMFTDHAILIRATLEDGPTSANIEG